MSQPFDLNLLGNIFFYMLFSFTFKFDMPHTFTLMSSLLKYLLGHGSVSLADPVSNASARPTFRFLIIKVIIILEYVFHTNGMEGPRQTYQSLK